MAIKIGFFASRVNFDPLKFRFLDYFLRFVNLFSDTISLLETNYNRWSDCIDSKSASLKRWSDCVASNRKKVGRHNRIIGVGIGASDSRNFAYTIAWNWPCALRSYRPIAVREQLGLNLAVPSTCTARPESGHAPCLSYLRSNCDKQAFNGRDHLGNPAAVPHAI